MPRRLCGSHLRVCKLAISNYPDGSLPDGTLSGAQSQPLDYPDPVYLSHEALYQRHAAKVLSKVAPGLAIKLGVDLHEMSSALELAHHCYWISRLEANTERAAEAKAALLNVAACAAALTVALKDLGCGASSVLKQGITDRTLHAEAEPWDLPDRDPVDQEPHWKQGANDEQARIWIEEWKRGGRWVIRLEALAKLSRNCAREVAADAVNRGPIRLGSILYGTPDERLMEHCLDYVREHGGGDPIARTMAQVIINSEINRIPTRSAGRKVLKRMSQPPLE